MCVLGVLRAVRKQQSYVNRRASTEINRCVSQAEVCQRGGASTERGCPQRGGGGQEACVWPLGREGVRPQVCGGEKIVRGVGWQQRRGGSRRASSTTCVYKRGLKTGVVNRSCANNVNEQGASETCVDDATLLPTGLSPPCAMCIATAPQPLQEKAGRLR